MYSDTYLPTYQQSVQPPSSGSKSTSSKKQMAITAENQNLYLVFCSGAPINTDFCDPKHTPGNTNGLPLKCKSRPTFCLSKYVYMFPKVRGSFPQRLYGDIRRGIATYTFFSCRWPSTSWLIFHTSCIRQRKFPHQHCQYCLNVITNI
jgi:hypothetical protein